jgi:hypothetical protein
MHYVIARARWHENLRFLLGHFLTCYLSGTFDRLRKCHGSDRILVRLAGRPVLLLFEPEDIRTDPYP